MLIIRFYFWLASMSLWLHFKCRWTRIHLKLMNHLRHILPMKWHINIYYKAHKTLKIKIYDIVIKLSSEVSLIPVYLQLKKTHSNILNNLLFQPICIGYTAYLRCNNSYNLVGTKLSSFLVPLAWQQKDTCLKIFILLRVFQTKLGLALFLH